MFIACTSTGSTPSVWIASTQKSLSSSRQNRRSSPGRGAGRWRTRRARGRPAACAGRRPPAGSSRPARAAAPLGVRLLGHHDQLDAAAADTLHPRVDVGRVLDAGGDDAVAPLPVDAVGDDADALAGVLDERDLVAVRVHHRRRGLPEPLDILVPVRAEVGLGLGFGRRSARIASDATCGSGQTAGVVEEVPLPQHREGLFVADVALEVGEHVGERILGGSSRGCRKPRRSVVAQAFLPVVGHAFLPVSGSATGLAPACDPRV